MQANTSDGITVSVNTLSGRVEKRTGSMIVTNLLRGASILALVQYSAHAFLFLTRTLTHDPGPIASMAASRAHSYWDFYFGYGLLAILSGVVEIVLLWQLASIAKKHADKVRPAVALFIFANLAHAFLVWKYFSLPAPVMFDVVIAMLLAFAFIVGQRRAVDAGLLQ